MPYNLKSGDTVRLKGKTFGYAVLLQIARDDWAEIGAVYQMMDSTPREPKWCWLNMTGGCAGPFPKRLKAVEKLVADYHGPQQNQPEDAGGIEKP